MTILSTQRLGLTPVTADDLPDLMLLWGNADFTRHIMGPGLTHEEIWLRCLRDIGHWHTLGFGNWSIRLTSTGDYIGSIGLLTYCRDLSPAFDSPELGWGISPHFQGQNLAFEAARAALDWTDVHRSEPRTVCMISPENAPSIRLAKRLGYQSYAHTAYKGSDVILYERPRSAPA